MGLAYGSVFSLFPTVCLEWFGMRKFTISSATIPLKDVIFHHPAPLAHFSENWGYMCMSPVIAANLFSLVFGRNLDAHERLARPSFDLHELRRTVSGPQCLEGRKCYVDTIYLTAFCTFLAILLSIWAGYRDRQKIVASQRKTRSGGDVIWEDRE